MAKRLLCIGGEHDCGVSIRKYTEYSSERKKRWEVGCDDGCPPLFNSRPDRPRLKLTISSEGIIIRGDATSLSFQTITPIHVRQTYCIADGASGKFEDCRVESDAMGVVHPIS